MAASFNPRAFVRERPIASVLAGLVLVLLLLLAFARFWIATDSGRDFVISQIDGREVAGYGQLSVRKLEGDPLKEFTLESLEIRDAQGVWLSASDIRMAWSPMALLSRTVELGDLAIADVNLMRRPVRTERPETESEPWGIRLGNATIGRFRLAEGVAGPETALGVTARFLNERNGTLDAMLQITPLDGAGDRIEARILRERNSTFDVKIDSVAPAGGAFAHLLQLPEGASAVLTATAAGDLEDGRGEARLTVDGTDEVFISAKIENSVLDAGVRFDAVALPIPPDIAQFLGPSAEADVTVHFERAETTFDIASRLSAGTISVSGTSRADRLELREPARIKASLNTLAPFWADADALDLDGTLEAKGAGFQYVGDARLTMTPDSDLPFAAASGPLTVSLSAGRIPFAGEFVVEGFLADNEEAAAILGETAQVSGNGAFDLATRRLQIDAAEVTHGSGTVQLLGETGFSEGDLNFSGKITQSLAALPGGFGGTASGVVQAKGELRNIELGLNVNLAGVTSGIDVLRPLVAGRGSVRGMLQLKPDSGEIRRLDVRLSGVEGVISGGVYGPASPDLQITAEQNTALELSGNQVNLGAINARLARAGSGFRLSGDSEGGSAFVSGQSVTDLTANTNLLINDGSLTGPVTLTGRSGGQPASVTFRLNRSGDETRFENVDGALGSIALSGSAMVGDNGAFDADLDGRADDFEIAGLTFGSLRVNGRAARATGRPFEIGGDIDARRIQLSPRLLLDTFTGSVATTDEGYRISGRLVDSQTRADSNLGFSGLVSLAGGFPSGRMSLSGALLGVTLETDDDIQWSLGPAPTADADIRLLGGRLQVRLRPGSDAASSSLTAENLAVAPLLVALGYPAIDAVVSADAAGRLYGENPEGRFTLSATSPVSGVNTPIDFDLTGRLGLRAITFTAQSTFGPTLKANAAGRIPVTASAGQIVALDRAAAFETLIEMNGALEAVQLIALAYGHDVGGNLQSRIELGGSLAAPVVRANAAVTRGVYENGATGIRLRDIALNAGFANRILTLDGSGAGAQGGTFEMSGRLAPSEAGVTVDLNRILVFDRLGDQARLSGKAQLTEGADDRVLSGALTINEARFNIENFSDTSIRTLNVRWVSDEETDPGQTVLRKPIRLDLTVNALRGVIVTGRGLDSDWGVNLAVTGHPDDLLLNGRATLVRGSLELAQRPFQFETGQITFDGPLDTARMAVSATREVDGFSVRADVGGRPTRPTVELSSTPSLPDDEILSRMLFGRSAVDLSALEAAELASSIARLAGQDTGIDPIGAIQAGLGVDRLRVGIDDAGNAELGVGQYLAPDVYLEVTTQGAAGNSVEVEWQPRPQVSISSETRSTGDSRVSVRWKKDY